MQGRTLRRSAVAGLLAVLAAGCGDGGTGPGEALELTALGSAQTGVEGELLLRPLRVRLRDDRGQPVPGEWVRFQVTSGDGVILDTESVTDGNGEVLTWWRLGTAGPQEVEARVEGGPVLAIPATALPVEEADVVVIRGALAPVRGTVLLRDTPDGVEIVQERMGADTLLRLVPQEGPGLQLLVFPRGNRPAQVAPAWTPGVDSVVVELLPPVAVDMDFRVHQGDFATQAEVIRTQLENTARAWRHSGAGLVPGEITVEDRTAEGGNSNVSISGICQGLTPGAAIQIAYVGTVQEGGLDGYGCNAGYVFMSLRSGSYPYLLGHELGHTFTLLHTSAGMMNPWSPGSGLRDGEVYRAHFNAVSALNTIFGSQPEEARRSCVNTGHLSPCLPMDYVLGSHPTTPPAGAVVASLGKGRR